MYFNFEDYRPDTPTLPRSLTRLEVVLLTVVVYLSIIIFILISPHLPWVKAWEAERQQALAEQQKVEQQRQRDNARFVFNATSIRQDRRRGRGCCPVTDWTALLFAGAGRGPLPALSYS